MSLRFLIIWSICVLATVAWMQMSEEDLGKGPVLAVLDRLDGAVEVRRSGSLVWDRARPDMRLHAYDSLSTSKKSLARLVLQDGTTLTLPADTQLKLQPQDFAQGIEISVIKGAISVSKAPVILPGLRPRTTILKTASEERLPAFSQALSLVTNAFRLDLSQVSGDVKVSATNAIQATRPEKIRIETKNQAIRLVDLKALKALPKIIGAAMDLSIDQLVDNFSTVGSRIEPAPIKLAKFVDLLPEDSDTSASLDLNNVNEDSASADAPPEPEPEPSPIIERKLFRSLPLDVKAVDATAWIHLRSAPIHFWTSATFPDVTQTPIRVPLASPAPQSADWTYVLKLTNVRSSQSRIVQAPLSEARDAFLFTLAQIAMILPATSGASISLQLEAGLLRPGEADSAVRVSGVKTEMTLNSLAIDAPRTMRFAGWEASANRDWFSQNVPQSDEVILHALDTSTILQLGSFVQGSEGFSIEPFKADDSPSSICFVSGNSVNLIAETAAPEVLAELARRLEPDIIFEGSPSALIGRKGSFSLRAALDKYPAIYMAHKGRVIMLDWNLLKTQEVARRFLAEIDTYFFNTEVKVRSTAKILQAH